MAEGWKTVTVYVCVKVLILKMCACVLELSILDYSSTDLSSTRTPKYFEIYSEYFCN